MSATAERLLDLLPAVYRRRDAEQGGALGELLAVVADQLTVLEESLEQLYDDQFVETCAPWLLPYIGDLLGVAGLPASPLTPRAEVAHTIAYRRRKGTAAVLEQLAYDVTGLQARAVEFFELLAATQNLNHLRLGWPQGADPEGRPAACQGFLAIRDPLRLEALGGPFERLPGLATLTHTVDVRRIGSGRGRYGIANVGVFLWRLKAFPLSESPATPRASGEQRRFRFSPLGNDMRLFNQPETEDEMTHLAEPQNVPGPISRGAADPAQLVRSFQIETEKGTVRSDEIEICDLSAWQAPAGKVGVDPVRGRFVLPANAKAPPLVSFHYGFAASIGGGEYPRAVAAEAPGVALRQVKHGPGAIQAAIDALPPKGGVVEIGDSGRYEEAGLTIKANGRRVVLRAALGKRPTVVLGGKLSIAGDPAGTVVIDGLLLSGAGLEVRAPATDGDGLGALEIRHTTLVPGIALEDSGEPRSSDPSLIVGAGGTAVTIERSIVGPLQTNRDAHLRLADSILDATDRTGVAFSAAGEDYGAPLSLEQATVIGRVKAEVLELVSNTILLAELPAGAPPDKWPGPVAALRTQEGCLRFSYLPHTSRTPKHFRCQPERAAGAAGVEPILTSSRYGDPGYCQLADATAQQIREGAEDEAELGAFHHLQLPRREAHLRARLDEHLRFGLEAGVIHAT